MTEKAINAIQESDIIVGYNTYIALIKDRIADKEIVGNGMRQEVDRCQKAVDLAVEGHKVAVISAVEDFGICGTVWNCVESVESGVEKFHTKVLCCIPSPCQARTNSVSSPYLF